jgi:hypothetical protein
MTRADNDPPDGFSPNPGYAEFQLAKALTVVEACADPEARERARGKVAAWGSVLKNILTGSVEYGTRAPLEGVPAWATLRVVTGGFATGELLAAGPLLEHEQQLLQKHVSEFPNAGRSALNAWYLSEEGLADLRERLRSGCYEVEVPEEGALLVVAWLVAQNLPEQARALLEILSPWLSTLRFYPIAVSQPRQFGARVHVKVVADALSDVRRIRPNPLILAQKEAVEVWTPFYDRMIALALETVEGSVPCCHSSDQWRERARSLAKEYQHLRERHHLCKKPEQANGYFAQLRRFLSIHAETPKSLTARQVNQLRRILDQYVQKRGTPDSAQCRDQRLRQLQSTEGPTFHEIAAVVARRMADYSRSEGLDDIAHLTTSISERESAVFRIPAGTPVPSSVRRKVERCLNETIAVLVERGLITSAEALARVLPQMTSGLRASGIVDPALRQLYGAIYRAFRRRRSLLLTNLQKQVQIEELPWVAAIEAFRTKEFSGRDQSKQVLREVVLLTLRSFPYAILPNKLLQELGALAKAAELEIPFVEEVATDIFAGEFSAKFTQAAKVAATLLAGTVYETYYGIDNQRVRLLPDEQGKPKPSTWPMTARRPVSAFAQLCSDRSGVDLRGGTPAANGMLIEQQQILTTQNLATLFAALGLADELGRDLFYMAQECFKWICERFQIKSDNWHTGLITLKNCAYAWRQMIFFLSLLPRAGQTEFLGWAERHLAAQSEAFCSRFGPAFAGLRMAASGHGLDGSVAEQSGARRFLGWSKERHWLLPRESLGR